MSDHIELEAQASGDILACFEGGYSIGLGKFSPAAVARAQDLRTGVRLGSSAPDGNPVDKEIELLQRRLARRGLLEYRIRQPGARSDQVVIEPQTPDYWPQTPKLADSDTLVLSRFAYLRRRADELILESPRAGALFRICDSKIASVIAQLAMPQKISKLRRQEGFPGIELLAMLVDCQILFRFDPCSGEDLRFAEGDSHLVLWDFHDLLFHTHSTAGRQSNPLGGLYRYADDFPSPPAVRPGWPGQHIDLRKFPVVTAETASPFERLLHQRHSVRSFEESQPITLAELSRFLDSATSIQATWRDKADLGEGDGPEVEYTARPYPSAGSAYELELYLAVVNCDGLERGFYHYDAGLHALVPIPTRAPEFDALIAGAEFAMDAEGAPQVLITMAARFDRIAWKYSSIAYSLIMKDVGVLIQTLYLMATDIGLGGCAIGSINIDLFSKMTGIEFHVEGPVGLFALGRGAKQDAD